MSAPSLLAAGAKTAAFELLTPAGLGLLALLAPLIALYILKIKRQRRAVGSTWLWAAAQRDLLARSPFRRLLPQVPLLIQAAAILGLALALARPASRGARFTGDHVAIILDASASMSAVASGPKGEATTRMALARDLAKSILDSLSPGSDAMVLEAGRDARLLSPFDRDLVRVRASIDRASARDVEGDLGPSVALAVDRLRQLGGARRVVLITDGNLAKPDALAHAALPIEVVTVGAPVDNAAIVRVDVRSGKDPVTHAEQVQGFLLVENFGAAPREVYVTMREDKASDVLASRRLVVQPGERAPVVLTFQPTPGDYRQGLVFEMTPHDGLPADDVAYGRVPAGDRLPVFLAGSSPWVERALRSDPQVELWTGSLTELGAREVPVDALVLVDGACPDGAPGGDLVVLHPPEGRCFGVKVGAEVEGPQLTSWEQADPRLRFLTLDGVHVARARLLEPEAPTKRLVSARQGTLVADAATSARSVTVVGFDAGESDWPLKASFVLFVRNLVEQARLHRAHGVAGPARVGEPIRVTVPEAAREVEALGPSGEKIEVTRRAGLAVLPETERAGFYRVSWKGAGASAGATLVPANLASAAESDLRTRPLAAEGHGVSVATDLSLDAHDEWTWVLALLALGLVVFDVWWFTRDPGARSPVASPLAPPRIPERRAPG